MNKIFKISNIMLLTIITVILLSCYTHIIDLSTARLIICITIILILLTISLIQLQKNNKILENKKYNILLLFVNIITLTILIRDQFDSLIPLGTYNYNTIYNIGASNGIFIDYNTIFIAIMYTGMLLYNLINKEKVKN